MSDRRAIERRLKEDRIPEAFWPDDWGEKKKRPREVAVVDVNLCFPCLKCPEFCPVGCIEPLAPGTLSGRGDNQPVQIRVDECIGCYICVEVCALLTDYDAIRMYDTDLVEETLGVPIGDTKPPVRTPPAPWEDEFAEGGAHRHLGHGSRIAAQISAEARARAGFKTPRGG
jgi:Pyruvate/2-oxoacid:ferredoxin oxidoreductase delta subunit